MNTKRLISLAAVVTIFSRCGSVSRNNFDEKISNPIEKIIYFSSLAGNSHNTQPWYVYIENDSVIHIKADFSRKLHIVDPDARGLFISLGAFIENFKLAAGSFGYKTDIEITAANKNDNNVATIHLSKSQVSGYDLKQIENRRTLRTAFHKKEISKEHLSKLINNNDSEVSYFSSSSKEGKFIAEQTVSAYTQQSYDDQAKQELASWMRFSNSDVEKHRDGLTTSGMGITGLGGFFVRNFFTPASSMKDSFIEKGIEKTKNQTDNCGGWVLIKQSDDCPESWIQTGRLYQSINLACKDMMIGFHPMNQMIEEENFENKVNSYLSLTGVIQFVARIGYVDEYPPANSVRRSVRNIIRYTEENAD